MLRQLCLWDPWPEVGLLQQTQKYPNLSGLTSLWKQRKAQLWKSPRQHPLKLRVRRCNLGHLSSFRFVPYRIPSPPGEALLRLVLKDVCTLSRQCPLHLILSRWEENGYFKPQGDGQVWGQWLAQNTQLLVWHRSVRQQWIPILFAIRTGKK